MRFVVSVILFGAALLAAPWSDTLEAPLVAVVAIAVGVSLSGLVSHRFDPLSVSLGALGALAHTALAPQSGELAGGAFLAFVYGPRALRARTATTTMVHMLVSLVSGYVSAAIALRYAHASFVVQIAALVVSGLVASVSVLVPVDDPIAHALSQASRELSEPTRSLLQTAVELRRRADTTHESLSRTARRRLEHVWRTLLNTATARLHTTPTAAPLLDERLRALVHALERVYRACEERTARIAGLDDHALTAARLEGERLEAEVAALEELVGQSSAPTSKT